MTLDNGIALTWLGHGTFTVTTPGGKTILIDPWVDNNPACPDDKKTFDVLDTVLITHGHFDHIGDAVPIANAHHPQVIGIYETCAWLEKKGVQNTLGINKGGGIELGDELRVTMVHADHSCGILDDDGSIIYGGEAVGYVLEFENGFTMYHAGDTNVFGDMGLIAELYQPELVCLPIGDLYTMSPREAAHAVKLLQPKYVVPMHHGTFPALTGTPDRLAELLRDQTGVTVLALSPGDSVS